MKRILVFLVLCPFWISAQSSYATLNESYYHLIDRYEVVSGQIIPQLFTTVKPYKRSDIVTFLDSANQLGVFTSRADQFNLEYFQNDNWEWARPETNDSRKPILKYFYRKKSDFLHVDEDPDFDLHVNPVLYLAGGKDSQVDDPVYINTRGIELRGMLDKKVGFYLYMADNQMRLPSYVAQTVQDNPSYGYYSVIPHEGFWKPFKEDQGYDFLHTRGYVSFEATRHLNFQFGHDRFFIGNGQRSLIFSDHGPPSLFLKGNVKVWRLNYLFSLNRMVADKNGGSSSTGKYPDKFVALHHLSINIGKKWNVGVFESVVFTDSTSFEWSYLNPIIFYRAIEQQFGSSDNVILGMDFKWNALKGVSLYGQFVLDEFVLDNIKDGNGWWANKYGIQAGVKYFNAFGVSNFDLQAETNIVRPYTYSHYTSHGNYSGYLQPIAHPLGANFKEIIGIVRYQPIPRLNLTGKINMMQVGRDTTNVNWGSDILKNNDTREQDYENKITQGVKNDILFGTFTASWQVKHNIFIDLSVVLRQSESPVPVYNTNTSVTSLALRWNIAQRLYEF
ncbi:MAG TPA: hypothetical protein VFU05_19300 [Cyclobacteriaceae bacterium]|nr:hypothetical protein [Cyclobacteriaceae bacterium]